MNAEVPYLFGTPELTMQPALLALLCSLCTPDKPFERPLHRGDIAFAEVCICEEEMRILKQTVDVVRADAQKAFVSDLLDALQARAKKAKLPFLTKLADLAEREYTRLCKIFFLRVRCYTVMRNSNNTILGRIVAFPDQLSDDYGNNLDEHNEKGLNTSRISRGHETFKSRVGSTLYIGHGQGATLAKVCACVADEPVVVFDPTFLSEVVSQNFFREEFPPKFEMDPRKEATFPWNALSYFFEPVLLRCSPILPEALDVLEKVVKQRSGKKLPPAEQAEAFFAKHNTYKATGVLSANLNLRVEKAGHYPASMLSDIYADRMTSVKRESNPFALSA